MVIDSALLQSARRAWPDVEIDLDEFARYVAERLDGGDPTAIHVGDLYLACACVRGDRRALGLLDQRFLREVGKHVAKIDASKAFADDVAQVMRDKLLVAEPGKLPKIADYRGRGPLGGWLRVAAIRAARDLVRSRDRRAPIEREHGPDLKPPAPDPELAYLKSRYGHELRTAFQTTLAALSPKQRNVLCLYFLEGMTSSAIGAMYRVQGATVRLWIKDLRGTILAETRRLLGERLGIDTVEFRGLVAELESQLDVSISRFLKKSNSVR